MDHARFRRERGQTARRAIVEARADDEQQIAFLHREIRRRIAMHAEHAQIVRVVRIAGAESLQRRHGRNAGQARELAQFAFGAGEADAAADVQQRLLRARQQRVRFGDAGFGRRRQARRHLAHGARDGARVRDVLGQIDQHRPGPTAGRDRDRFAHDGMDVLGAAHDVAVLDHGQAHAEHVDFLERIRAHQARRHLAGDREQRHRIEIRVREPGQQIGRAGPGGREADADAAARARIAVGGQRRTLLMPHEDVLERRIHERVVDRHDGAAGVAEDGVDAFGFQRVEQMLRAGAHAAGLGRCRRGRARDGGVASVPPPVHVRHSVSGARPPQAVSPWSGSVAPGSAKACARAGWRRPVRSDAPGRAV
jgi:hypothetical protein